MSGLDKDRKRNGFATGISTPVPLVGYNVKNMVFLILYIFNPCAPPRGATVNANGNLFSCPPKY